MYCYIFLLHIFTACYIDTLATGDKDRVSDTEGESDDSDDDVFSDDELEDVSNMPSFAGALLFYLILPSI